jgi:REase associating with pPIWI_RE
MAAIDDLPESCTADDAVPVVAHAAKSLGLSDPPSLRTLRLWRGKRLLTQDGRRFSRRNLLEALGITQLRAAGVTVAAAASRCQALTEEELVQLLGRADVPATDARQDYARDTLLLLAQGIGAQYRLVTEYGAIVGYVDSTAAPHSAPPLAFRQAAARLGRLFFEEEMPDLAASYLLLLEKCRHPLRVWAPEALWTLPDAADLVLVDPTYRVPSDECEAIAQQAAGAALEDLIEQRLHATLLETLSRLGTDQSLAYTTIRHFVGSHPLATSHELQELRWNQELPTPAVEFVQNLYRPVHADNARAGMVERCGYCRGRIGRDHRCVLQGCQEDHPTPRLDESVHLDHAFEARPGVLRYWVDPAREELRLWRALRDAGLDVRLYPHTDLCDVAIGEELGIDVKDFRNPVQLASKLNREPSGLSHYPKRILAVAERRLRTGDYLARLLENLSPENRRSLQVLGVNDTIRQVCAMYGANPAQKRRGRARAATT